MWVAYARMMLFKHSELAAEKQAKQIIINLSGFSKRQLKKRIALRETWVHLFLPHEGLHAEPPIAPKAYYHSCAKSIELLQYALAQETLTAIIGVTLVFFLEDSTLQKIKASVMVEGLHDNITILLQSKLRFRAEKA